MTDYESIQLLKLIKTAVYPWQNKGKKAEKYAQYDSEKRINKCLNCKLKECIDCHGDMSNAINILLTAGIKPKSICNLLDIQRSTFYRLQKGVSSGVSETG